MVGCDDVSHFNKIHRCPKLSLCFLLANFSICTDLLRRTRVLNEKRYIKLRAKLGTYFAASIPGQLRHAIGSELLAPNQTRNRGDDNGLELANRRELRN